MCAATVNNGGRRKSKYCVDQWASIKFFFIYLLRIDGHR